MKKKPLGVKFNEGLNVFGFEEASPAYQMPFLPSEQEEEDDIEDPHNVCMIVKGPPLCFNSSSDDDEPVTKRRMARAHKVPPNNFPAVVKAIFNEPATLAPSDVKKLRLKHGLRVEGLQEAPPPVFRWLNVPDYILQSLTRLQYLVPNPLQGQMMPILLSGHDSLLLAPQHTGRTISYSVPLIMHIEHQPERKSPCAVVFACNKQRAGVIAGKIKDLSPTYKTIHLGKRTRKSLQKGGAEIIVTTPIVFQDYVHKKYVSVKTLSFCVLHDGDDLLTNQQFCSSISHVLGLMNPNKQTVLVTSSLPAVSLKCSCQMP